MFGQMQHMVILAVSVAAFVGAVWALIDASRHPDSAYRNAGKQNKMLWVIILAVSSVVAFVSLPWPLGTGGGIGGILGMAVILAVAYYFVGIKPHVSGASGGPRRSGGSNSGGW